MVHKKNSTHQCVIPPGATIFSGVSDAILASYKAHPSVQRGDSAFIHDFLLLTIAEASGRRAPRFSRRNRARAFMGSVKEELKKWSGEDVRTKENLRTFRNRIFKAVLRDVTITSSIDL